MILSPLMGEIKIHEAWRVIPGVFTSKILRIPVAAAGLSEQSKTDRIKDRRLPRPGITGYQKQPLLLKLCEIDLRHRVCIRAEGTYDQFNRSHR